MALAEISAIRAVEPRFAETVGLTNGRTVIPVRGEHDLGTEAELAGLFARAIAQDDSAIVVDLSGITFMDASTVRVLVRASGFLRVRARKLTVQSPSTCARRVLELCDLSHLIEATQPPTLMTHGSSFR